MTNTRDLYRTLHRAWRVARRDLTAPGSIEASILATQSLRALTGRFVCFEPHPGRGYMHTCRSAVINGRRRLVLNGPYLCGRTFLQRH